MRMVRKAPVPMIARLLEVLSEAEMTVVSKYVPPFPSHYFGQSLMDPEIASNSARRSLIPVSRIFGAHASGTKTCIRRNAFGHRSAESLNPKNSRKSEHKRRKHQQNQKQYIE